MALTEGVPRWRTTRNHEQYWLGEGVSGGTITVCDTARVILAMNGRAVEQFAKDGGQELVGSNLLDCHPEPSRTKLQELLSSGKLNAYTIEKS
jgi:hypothetical protein